MTTEAEFRTAVLPFTLHEEGGLSLDRGDPGNWTGGVVDRGELRGTRYGISAAAHAALDIRHLTLAQACDIYWDEYCRRPGFDFLALPLLQVVFDAGVNCGTNHAEAWLAAARRHRTVAGQIAAVSNARLAYCRSRKTRGRYGAVWGGRIARCQAHALALAAVAPIAVAPPAPKLEQRPPAPRVALQPRAGLFASLLQAMARAFLTHTKPQRT